MTKFLNEKGLIDDFESYRTDRLTSWIESFKKLLRPAAHWPGAGRRSLRMVIRVIIIDSDLFFSQGAAGLVHNEKMMLVKTRLKASNFF